ncbi:MAG: hypothetical protein ABR973_14510 [Candidatus Acidiferrales bacterium]|jgi:hypothetical protein
MDAPRSTQSSDRSGEQPHQLRDILSDATRYWEPRRITYNFVLTGVVVVWLAATWPHFREALTLHSLLWLFILGMLANLCYCAAYVADVPMQNSVFRDSWRRGRWGLWLTGMLFAVVLANYWIVDEIYPYVR